MLASAAAFRSVKRASEFGISIEGIGVDFSKIIDRKNWIVSQIASPRMRKYFEMQGVDIIDGIASFKSTNQIEVDGKTISFDKAVIATGTTPFVPPIEGLDDVGYITSEQAIDMRELPESVIIVGGSSIGLEFGTFYESFGAEVVIVEMDDRLASKQDAEISQTIKNYLTSRGVTVYTGAIAKRAFMDGRVKGLVIETPDGETTLTASEIFIATGRRPVIDNLHLEDMGVKVGKKGIEVNEYLQTSIENIYAVGDVIPGPQLAQAAAYEGDLVAFNALTDKKTEVSYRVIPQVIWSDPPLSRVGMTEEEAKGKGINYTVVKFPLAGLGRAYTSGEHLGFVKVIADVSSEEVIGVHIIGHHADEIIHEGVIAMQSRIKAADLAQAIHCELTMAEGVGNAFIDLRDAINKIKRKAA